MGFTGCDAAYCLSLWLFASLDVWFVRGFGLIVCWLGLLLMAWCEGSLCVGFCYCGFGCLFCL